MKPIRALMVDDSPEYLEATGGFLSIYPYIDLIGQVTRGRDVIDRIQEEKPDLVLLDLALPDVKGLDLLPQIKGLPEPPAVIVVTFHNIPAYKTQAFALGADGFVLKADLAADLMVIINELFEINSDFSREEFTKGS
ncbi:MAG: response regulator transcription factor [Chloroflexi bacterium]|nr:response regulator transcription factor [Chloroflexota bacterium]